MKSVIKIVLVLMLAVSVTLFSGAGIALADTTPGQTAPEIRLPFKQGCFVEATYSNVSSPTNSAAINFYAGDNIALHVNPRPQPLGDVFVLNTLTNGAWGAEERPGGYPLELNKEISVSVWADAEGFVIKAKKEGTPTPLNHWYVYRLPVNTIDRVAFNLPNLKSWWVWCGTSASSTTSAAGAASGTGVSPTPAPATLTDSSTVSGTQYFEGTWLGSGYSCEQAGLTEQISITVNGDSLVATKITGDNCVPAGNPTFVGTTPTSVSKGSSVPVTFTTGLPTNPASSKTPANLTILDANSFTSFGVKFTRVK